ncbi:MAG: hypothetical protein ACRDIB_03735, partial [Ardenticatenaceae bacterium]
MSFGWSLGGLGQILLDVQPDGTNHSISLPGVSARLKETANDGWQTDPQAFLHIEHAGGYNPWHIWTTDGTKYTFELEGQAW